MIPVVGSLANLGPVIVGFVLGFIAKTVLPYEYKRLRRKAEQSSAELEKWNQETLELVSETRVIGEKLEYNRSPELKEKAEEVEDLRIRLEKHNSRAPDGAFDEVVENLREISVSISTIPAVYSDVYTNSFTGTEIEEIPLESEFDSIEDGDGMIFINRAVRKLTNDALYDKVYPAVDEIEDELDSK